MLCNREEAPHDPLKPHQSPWETSQTLLDFWASFSSGESTIDSDSLIYLLTAAALYRSVIMFIMSASFITSFISCIFSLRPTCFKQLRSLLMTGGFVTQLLFNWRSQRTKDTAATNPAVTGLSQSEPQSRIWTRRTPRTWTHHHTQLFTDQIKI